MDQIIDLLYQVAIYLRLSKDDGDFSFSGASKTESNSIHNQRELLIRISYRMSLKYLKCVLPMLALQKSLVG